MAEPAAGTDRPPVAGEGQVHADSDRGAVDGGKDGLGEADDCSDDGMVGPVVNPSGGLISKGHPLGATGLAQCSELTWQLRGEADKRQVAEAGVALQHNIGLGGAAVVTVYRPARD